MADQEDNNTSSPPPPPPSTTSPSSKDTTFRFYTRAQGATYAQNRRGYHPRLYQAVMEHHTASGGRLDTILDVGCGPGTAIRALAPYFSHAIGLDPSEGMIDTARSLGGSSDVRDEEEASSTSKPIRFEVSSAEDLGSSTTEAPPVVSDGSVDLITVATAAHWFDMSRFWPRAAEVLRPNGTVAIWSSGSLQTAPSVPNAAGVQAELDAFEDRLKDYMLPGNLLTRGLYRDLPLPWTLETPVQDFDRATFVRREWSTDPGADSADSAAATAATTGGGDDDDNTSSVQQPPYLDRLLVGEQQEMHIDTVEKVFGTISPVTRWREAHPDAVGTEHDVVRIMRRNIERLLHDAGVEKGKEVLKGTVSGVLLMVKKKKAAAA